MPERNSFGSALLAFNTQRQPDLDRGKGLTHFELDLDPGIRDEILKWERGQRPELYPREAAAMLWSTKTATHLDGRIDAWASVPGVQLILPGWLRLTAQPQNFWPGTQAELIKLVAEAQNTGMQAADLMRRLKNLDDERSAADFLNDLVLIFKYAATGYRRPIHLAADLYRLARTLLADQAVAPKDVEQMFNWLTAPLVVPRVFTAPLGPAGPRAPKQIDIVGTSPRSPAPLVLDLKSPQIIALIEQIKGDLDKIDRIKVDETTGRALRSAGVVDPNAVARAIDASHPEASAHRSSRRASFFRKASETAKRRTPRIITKNIGGFPVRIDMAETTRRAELNRQERTMQFISGLPEGLKSRLNVSMTDGYVMELPQDVLDQTSSHPETAPTPSYLEPVGRTDLLLVRQVTTGYRRAEIAHVENVLIGEKRERDHTKRVLTRDELFEGSEIESEETSDLQTTDSSKLSSEVSKVVSEDLRAQGTLSVTYRGATKVVATVAGSFEKSTENAAKTATEYATEIVDRAVKRMVERTKRESRSLFEQEIVEVNRHHFAGEANVDHVTGVYQYLERVSRAKVFSYGERDLYDILVPEPAALIWNLAIPSEDGPDVTIEEPDHDLFDSLTLANIESKMEQIISSFKVVDFPPIPKSEATVSLTFSGVASKNSGKLARSESLRIPDGYTTHGADYSISVEHDDADNLPNGGIVVGGVARSFGGGTTNYVDGSNHGTDTDVFTPEVLPEQQSSIAVGIHAENFHTITGSVNVHLRPTEAKLREWQLEAYSHVAERYEQMRRDAQLALVRDEATQPVAEDSLPVGARRKLKKLVHDELQRAAIGIMRNAPVDFDLMNEVSGRGPPYPTTDLDALRSAEPVVRFLQQAFEWEHLSWVLYPYFWGRREGPAGWGRTVVQDHPDPDFAAFLNSGAARLQVSVRPGFEDLVKHFMETGEAYEGQGLPKMGDAGYIPFIDEQINSLGGPGDEVAWPPAGPIQWDVISPTPLILVRKVAEERLPSWNPATGEENNG
jgi:hypothetical protein